MRIEVIIQLLIALSFTITWFLAPLWSLKSNIYSQDLTPLGFSITFLNHRYFLFIPNTITALTYIVVSAVIPLIWRGSRYSLYLSLFALSLGIMLIITALIFQSRYLFYGGYSILSTATGYMYIKIPYKTYFNVPLYLLIILFIVTTVNAVTRARWIRMRRLTIIEEALIIARISNPVNAVRKALDKLGIQYKVIDNSLIIDDLAIIGGSAEKRPADVKEYVLFTERNSIYFDGSTITELSTEQGILLALSKSLMKGKPGRMEAIEYA